jgi:hypothetical protein
MAINPAAIRRKIKMSNSFRFPKLGLRLRPWVSLVALSITLSGCGQASSENAQEDPGNKSMGIVSDAPIQAAQQAVVSLEQQKLLQSQQATDAAPRPEQSQADREAALKAAAAKTDEILKQAAEDAAESGEQP